VRTLSHAQYVKFIERVQTIVNKYGKKMIGWEEIAQAHINPTTITHQWKSDSAGSGSRVRLEVDSFARAKSVSGHEVHTSDRARASTGQRTSKCETRYDWDPATYMRGVSERDVFGVEAPMWSESRRNITAVEYLALPRLPAVAELAWTPQALRKLGQFPHPNRDAPGALELPLRQLLSITTTAMVKRAIIAALVVVSSSRRGSARAGAGTIPGSEDGAADRHAGENQRGPTVRCDSSLQWTRSLALAGQGWQRCAVDNQRWLRSRLRRAQEISLPLRNFGDVQLHIEWATPAVVKARGQNAATAASF